MSLIPLTANQAALSCVRFGIRRSIDVAIAIRRRQRVKNLSLVCNGRSALMTAVCAVACSVDARAGLPAMIAAMHAVPFASFVSKRFAVKQMPAAASGGSTRRCRIFAARMSGRR
jgi:hypothetical protein